jgi:hypothetical protein
VIDLEDGEPHTIGPILLRYNGVSLSTEGEPIETATCWITRAGPEGAMYALDYCYAKALATALEPLADIFSVSESDREERRGELRLRASGALKHGVLKATAKNEVYPLARIIMNVRGNEAVDHKGTGDRSERDYRRASLVIVGGKHSKHTRKDFIENGVCVRVAKRDGEVAAIAMRSKLERQFAEADALCNAIGTISVEFPLSQPESKKGKTS